MIRLLPVACLAPLLLAGLSGCPSTGPGEGVVGTLDTAGVANARFGEEYLGQLGIEAYDGPARFTLNSGSLPQGLEINEAGRISGTTTWVETATFEVLVTDMTGIEDFVGSASIDVTIAHRDDIYLGYEHDQFNNMIDHPNREYMSNIWVRIQEGGEAGMSEYTIKPGYYLAGANETPEGGRGDDVRIGDVAFADLNWTMEDWEATEETRDDLPGYPSAHLPEGDDPTLDDSGVFTSGVDGGEARLTMEHPDLPNTIQRVLQVVPPDWCPKGDHDGHDAPGFCA